MRILKLKLRGAIGIKKGLGVDEIEIDFTTFEAGLVALTGRNGSGKTTIMENLHPYRQMVSRDGSLQQHFFLKDSHRILTFEYDNAVYVSKILIDGLTGKSEAYLFIASEDGTNAIPLNDGKVSTYDEMIVKLLGSPELFFNSVFSGQKSKGIAELSAGDRRKLFYELLNLNSYEVYLEKAKEYLKSGENKLAKIEGEISALQQDQTSIDILEEQRKDKLEYQAQLIGDISDLEIKIVDAQESTRKNEIQLKLAEERKENNSRLSKEIEAFENKIQEMTQAHNRKVIAYNNDITSEKTKLERNQKLVDPEYKKKLENSVKSIADNEAELKKLKEQESIIIQDYSSFQKEYGVMLKGIGTIEKSSNDEKVKLTHLTNNLKNANSHIEEINKKTSLIKDVPCDENTGKSCQFLVDAYGAKDQLEFFNNEVNRLTAEIKTVENNIDSIEKTLTAQKQAADEYHQKNEDAYNKAIVPVKVEMSSVEGNLAELKKYDYAKLLDEQKDAENNIKLIEQSISGIEKLITEARESFHQSVVQIRSQIDDANKKIDLTIDDKIEQLRTDLSLGKTNLLGLQQQLQSSQARLNDAKTEVAKIEQQVEIVKKNEEKIAQLNIDKASVESDIKDWNFLIKAFGKEGIPVLKLENSGIEITSVANELLSIFENKFRIVFETTKLKADKKSYKESFDINIIEDDGVCEISNKSGGERVWVETALRLAISLMVRQQGKNLRTSFLDEADGALSLDNAYLYLEMLKKAHQKSGVHNTFIITHRTELLDLLPQQVKLKDGVLEVVN